MASTATAGSGTAGTTNRLRRDVGFGGLMFISLGSIIGSGWLLGALTASSTAGPASLISWVLAAIFLTLLALVHAELGASYPVSGGTARFPHFAFGGLAGFTAAWMAWLQAVTIAPIEVEAALEYTNNKWHGLLNDDGTLSGRGYGIAVLFMLVFTIINLVGVKLLAESNSITVLWKTAVPILTIVTLLILSFHASNVTSHGFAPYGAKGVMAALPAGVVFALQGFEQAIQMGGEARNPQKDVARAIIAATGLGAVIYILLQLVFIGAIDPGHLTGADAWAHTFSGDDKAPYATLATQIGASWLAVILYIDAVISPAGTGLVYIGTSSRLSYAFGRNRYFPPIISRIDRRGVPIVSVLLAFVIGLIVFLPFPSWQNLVGLVTSATVLMYAFAPVSLGALRLSDPTRRRPYRLRAAGVVSPASFIISNLIVYWAGWKTDSKLFLAVVVGLVLFAISYVTKPADQRPVMDWRAASWVWPWLGGLALISYLGQFDGRKTIPFWWDLLVVAIFSLAIYYFAVSVRMAPEKVFEALVEEEEEAADEPELAVS